MAAPLTSGSGSPSRRSASAASAGSPPPVQIETSYDGEVAPPPQTDPLGITGDDIEDLQASIAPPGSELLSDYSDPEEPQIDLAGLEVAPVGSDLDVSKKEAPPPPPDTTGITMADE